MSYGLPRFSGLNVTDIGLQWDETDQLRSDISIKVHIVCHCLSLPIVTGSSIGLLVAYTRQFLSRSTKYAKSWPGENKV